ncbi:hypothetical protein [Nonomuraea guangzhouensis]|uniref:Apea-like HEPN domain-containing protein n=1 Tax=Nonomuraea guangzhouensis TaxID=1291555 RepID=A0ABW4GGN3_9ACTN|nr:hypothetical protein [Nonomuraea guangzhouensis]
MLDDNQQHHYTAKRMLDFATAATPWHRRLWRLGTLLELSELLEAINAKALGALAESSVKYLGDVLAKRIQRDPGMGSPAERGQLIKHVNRTMQIDGHDWVALNLLLQESRPKYLSRWASHLRDEAANCEPVARAIVSHIMDEGYSAEATHKWFTYHIKYSKVKITLSELCEEAQVLLNRPKVRFNILVPLTACPPLPEARPDCWLDSPKAAEWLAHWFPSAPNIRQSGGLVLEIDAKDKYSALKEVNGEVDRLTARFQVGARQRLEFHPTLYMIGEQEPLDYIGGPRRVQVHALERTKEVFRLRLDPQIDAALELLQPLDRGTPAAATAGSWAALEALLIGPGDTSNRVVAATRMARIVTCGYITSELLSLAQAHASTRDDAIAAQLRSISDDQERAVFLEKAIRSGTLDDFESAGPQLALLRIRALTANPNAILPRIVNQLEDSFRRLYRQRNLIVHAGQTGSVALEGTLRTVSPLVGAGVDRVVQASALYGIPALMFAAATEVRLAQSSFSTKCLSELFGTSMRPEP